MNVISGFSALIIFLLTVHSMQSQSFYFGADLSYTHEMEDCGAVFTENGDAKDPFTAFRDHGANLIRLRLWHTPAWYDALNQGQRYGDLADVKLSIQRAKSLDMQVLLGFQLSDSWADPAHQVVPGAWAGVVDNLPVLEDSLYQYVHSVLINLASENLLPELVQIGNETNRGILLSQAVNDMGWSVDWTRNAALFNTAIDAVRDVEDETGKPIKIALHIADPSELNWWFNQFWIHGVQDFDIIGMSYYHAYHQDLIATVGNVVSAMKNTYPGKEVMILETAYPWTSGYDDSANNLLNTVYPGYPFSPANQLKWLTDLTQTVLDRGGSGIVYWDPDWVSTGCYTQYGQGSNWENAAFYDFENELIEDGGITWMKFAYDFPSAVETAMGEDLGFEFWHQGNEIWISSGGDERISGKIEIALLSLDGRRLISRDFRAEELSSKVSMDLSEVSNGLYVVVVSGDWGIWTGKILVAR